MIRKSPFAFFIKAFLIFSFGLTVFTSSMVVQPKKAEACCSCITTVLGVELGRWIQNSVEILIAIELRFAIHRIFFKMIIWRDTLLAAMKLMAEQLTVVAFQQSMMAATLMDAKHQLETQQLFQALSVRAHKDYHTSIGMCEFGTQAKSLAASDRKADMNAFALSQRSQDRQLGNRNSAAASDSDDIFNRLRTYRQVFCDPKDNDAGLNYMCQWEPSDPIIQDGENVGGQRAQMDNDIDYSRVVDWPWTLNVDLTNAAETNDEKDIFGLAANLYGHNVFYKPPSRLLEPEPGKSITGLQRIYQDARSLVAKRSVAENSFNAIVSMKSEGAPGARQYLAGMLGQLGVSNAGELLGKDGINPSYYAQMETLTKKIYQHPDFYTNLYDKPMNVERKGVAMEAIGLMQKFDLFESYVRNEATLSVLLELVLSDLQDELDTEIGKQKSGGTPGKD